MRLKHFLSVFLTLLTLSVGQMWGATTAKAGDVLWQESFTGGSSSTTFSATNSWSTGTGTSMLNSSDKSDISYSTNNAMLSTVSSGGVTGSHVWLKKETTGYFQVNGIPVYNATKVQFSLAKNSKVQLTITYKRSSDSNWQSGGTIGASKTSGSSSEITVTPNSTISIKIQRANNSDASRIDDLTLTAIEIQQVVTCNTDPTVGDIMNDVSGITASGATFTTSAGVSAGSNCSLSEVGFVYGTSSNPTITTGTKATIANYSSGNLSKSVTGLNDNTTYYVRAFATNGHGTTYSDQKSFSTPELAKYTVQFSTGEGNPTKEALTEASAGTGITLPNGPTPRCSGDGWVFMGWKETSAQASSTTAPDMLAAGMTYKPTSNCTLYAVYYKPADTDPNNYTKVTSNSNNLTSGQYVIYANSEALNNVITSNKIAGKSVSEASTGVITTTDADIIWTLYKNGTNYQLYNAGVSKYLEVTGQNSLSLPTSSKGFTLQAFSTTTGQVSLKSVNQTSYQFQYYNGNFSSFGSQSTAIFFYKQGGTYNSNPSCCTELGSINGSFFWSTPFCPVWPAKHRS